MPAVISHSFKDVGGKFPLPATCKKESRAGREGQRADLKKRSQRARRLGGYEGLLPGPRALCLEKGKSGGNVKAAA